MMKKILAFPYHTIVFAVFTVISMFASNYGEVNFQSLWRPLAVSILTAAAVLLTCYLIFKNLRKAGLIATWLLFFFFTYGHFRDFIKSNLPVHSTIISIGIAAVWVVLMLLGAFFLAKKVKNFVPLQQITTAIVVSALILPLIQIGYTSAKTAQYSTTREVDQFLPYDHLNVPPSNDLPDIYFFILDSYARQDVLQNQFGYDNSPFLNQLENEGFYIAKCSLSNYNKTALSVTSTLDYDYIQNLGIDIDPNQEDRTEVWYLFKHNRVIQQLKELGYKTVAFETGYDWSSLKGSDYYYRAENASISPFETMLIDSTLLSIPLQAKEKVEASSRKVDDYRSKYNEFINRQLYILNKMNHEVPNIRGPKFVFVHLMIPHPPYVFDPEGNFPSQRGIYSDNGSPVNDKYYRIGFTNQTTFINNRMLEIIKNIKAASRVQPIILIEGDHGPFRTYEKKPLFRITENLNAYYLPDGGADKLYPSISPINSFRVIFNTYFGMNYPLLEDTSYPSDTKFFNFERYSEQSPECLSK